MPSTSCKMLGWINHKPESRFPREISATSDSRWYHSNGFPGGSVSRVSATWEIWVQSLGREHPLEKEMATHFSILAWRIPWTEGPGGLQSLGSQRVGRDWRDLAHVHPDQTMNSRTLFRNFISPHFFSWNGSLTPHWIADRLSFFLYLVLFFIVLTHGIIMRFH